MEGKELIMKIYGYEMNGEELLELEETSIDCTLEESEKLIEFFSYVKKKHYGKKSNSMCHTHLRDWDTTWKESTPDLIIVSNN